MRVRVDANGRPRPPQNSNPPPPDPPKVGSSKAVLPSATPTTKSPHVAKASSSNAKASTAKASTAKAVDDERASDSSSQTEAYNSEDEHTAAFKADTALPTMREREAEFAAMLMRKGLRIVEMRADGNCLFRALAHGLWGDAELHMTLRAKVIEMLVEERDYFSQFVAEDFARYVRRKRREGVHGNHLELQAAAELFARPIEVFSYSDVPSTIVEPWGGRVAGVSPVRLSFHRGSHYNAVVSMDEQKGKECEDVDEMERAVLALSLVEASRGEGAGSSVVVPSAVLALVHAGYSEECAWEAYRQAGGGGVQGMIRFLRGRD